EKTCENNKQLFIVYGHDKIAKEQLEHILEKLDIQTNQITNNTGMTIIEALEKEISCVHAGIVLLTPDDISLSKKDYEEHKDNIEGYIYTRARQNVILEMGMIMAKLGRKNTIILSKGEVEIPSDIDGVFRLQFKENPTEILKKLVERLEECGFIIDKNNVFKAMD
ncbi:MAG: nucleotide-binding protein, partial [Helicobacter sp.]|nr:nucleotide-binding protein [Helicobacter sp.]